MAGPTEANPSLGPLLPGYDASGHQTNVALRVTNIQVDTSVTPNVTYGDLVVNASVTATPPSAAVSTVNSTTTPLTANSVFTGISESSLAYGSISVEVFADQASAANGLEVHQSQDGTNWDIKSLYSVVANTAFQQTINLVGQFYRIKYTNGATNQGTFRLQTIKEVGISPAAGVSNQRVSAQSGDFVDGAIATLGAAGDANTVATVMGRLTKIRDLLLGFVFDNTDRLKTSLYVKTSAAADTILTLGQSTKAGSLPVTIASDQGNLGISGTVTANAGTGNMGSNLTQVGGSPISSTNPVPTNSVAQAGEVALYGSNPSALTANTDAAIKWGASGTTAVNHVLIANNWTTNINYRLDAATTAGSDVLAPGQKIVLDVAGTLAAHIQGNGTPNINGSSAGNIVVIAYL